ncbi:hypothetical protein Vadar_018618 [Vaccinium darrowii]|uniref:Uncharacterized protein n=1 Tax=Vaccinium darrowii TaxID=229202 RepID=A0ACB7X1U5_9ERIC|nr:hypothetical protein Vadar_018618 [Vaccinium darrowii]
MTVSEYEAKFTNLAEYAPHMVATENMKARKLEDGLKPEILKVVQPMRLPTYAEVVDRALIVEQENEESKRFLKNRKRQRFNDGKKSGGGSFNKQNMGSQVGKPNNPFPLCATCGRPHLGVCLRTSNRQRQGQIAPAQRNNGGQRQGKAFVFMPGDPRNAEEVVAGKDPMRWRRNILSSALRIRNSCSTAVEKRESRVPL